MDFSELFPSVWSWEFLGFITGILSVLLLIFTKKERIQWFNWVFGAISAAVYVFLFKEWALYGNSILQIPFFLISIVGAWTWRGQLLKGFAKVREVPTTFAKTDTLQWSIFFATVPLIFVIPFLIELGDSNALFDGLILTISLSAIWLQLKKHVESWYFWILVDLIAVPFHIYQDHVLTGVLYFVYMLICVQGLVNWKREARVHVKGVHS